MSQGTPKDYAAYACAEQLGALLQFISGYQEIRTSPEGLRALEAFRNYVTANNY
jgi:hypothetical protein